MTRDSARDDPATLLERTRQLDVLSAAVASVCERRGCLVVVEGGPGTGRSTMLEIVRRMSADAGLLVMSAHGTPLETGISHGLAMQLLEPELRGAGRRDRGRLLTGETSAITQAFDERRWPRPSASAADGMLNELFIVVRSLAAQRPLLITVDDAHWADEMSLRLLLYLAQRLQGIAVGLVVTVPARRRGGNGPLLEQLARSPGTRCIELPALSDGAAATLVRRVLPDIDDEAVRTFTHATGGNPLLLARLAESVTARATPSTEADLRRHVETAPVALLRAAMMRLEHLAKRCTTLARAVAVLGEPVGLRAAAAVAAMGLADAAAAASALEVAGMLGDGEPLRFVEPLLGWVAYADIPSGIRARMHALAARVRADARASLQEIGAHAERTSPSGDRRIVEWLLDAATQAASHGRPARAIELLQRAYAEPPAADQHAAVLMALGDYEAEIGSDAAPQHLLHAADLTDDAGVRTDTRRRAGRLLRCSGHSAHAARVLDDAIRELQEDGRGCPLQLTADHLAAALLVPARAADARSRVPTTSAGADAATVSGLSLLARILAGEPVGPHDMPDDRAIDGDRLLCLLWNDQLVAAERACSAVVREDRGRLRSDCVQALIVRSTVRLRRGELAAAADDAEQALAGAGVGWRMAAAACAVHCLIERDDLDGATAVLARSVGDDELGTGALATARLDIERGDPARGLQRLLETGHALMPVTENPAVLAWRSEAARAAAALGEREDARRLADAELVLARRFAAPRALGVALRAAGEAAGGEAGVAHLRGSVDALGRSPARLELARSHVALGTALRAAGRRTDAREELRAAAELAERLGASRLQSAAREELARAGARPRRRDATGLDSLTPGERRVAELVARGLCNREIAEDLVVTPKAVEWHLRHLYRKLDIVGRQQLIARLRDLGGVGPQPLPALERSTAGTA